tara:strand:- start:1339 stop:1986 length:648 start_codon:yes stop_codon:yes gene_type:complete
MSFNVLDLSTWPQWLNVSLVVVVVVLLMRCAVPEIYNDIMGNFSGVLPPTITHVEPFTDFAPAPGAPVAAESMGDGQAVPKPVENMGRTPSSCYPQDNLTSADLLPKEDSQAIKDFNVAKPAGEGILNGVNLLDAGFHVGVNTVGQSLRNANLQLRSEPPNPQVQVSPFLNTTIGPDLMRKPIEDGEGCAASPGAPAELPGAGETTDNLPSAPAN